MIKVIGVKFRQAGKIYYFDPGAFEVSTGDHIIVETARGVEFGTVIRGVHEVDEIKVVQPLRSIIRIANEEDVARQEENLRKKKEAFQICKEKIRKHQLDMKLIDCEFTFDNSKILFYFTADGRIDFRDLVKDLASIFRTRIELRQVGVRDETKLLGGIGICGRPLCCHSYLSEFIPVSIKMAKEQSLSLNPTKISGVCGRLMCCLKNEEEVYESLNRKLPGMGDWVVTPDGLKGEVQSVSILKQLVKVIVSLPNDEKEVREYAADELRFKPRQRRGGRRNAPPDEKELEELMKLDALERKGQEEPLSEEGAEEERPRGRRKSEGFERGDRSDRPQQDRRGPRGDREQGRNRNRRQRDGQPAEKKVELKKAEPETGSRRTVPAENRNRPNSREGENRDRQKDGGNENRSRYNGNRTEGPSERNTEGNKDRGQMRRRDRWNRRKKKEAGASADGSSAPKGD